MVLGRKRVLQLILLQRLAICIIVVIELIKPAVWKFCKIIYHKYECDFDFTLFIQLFACHILLMQITAYSSAWNPSPEIVTFILGQKNESIKDFIYGRSQHWNFSVCAVWQPVNKYYKVNENKSDEILCLFGKA